MDKKTFSIISFTADKWHYYPASTRKQKWVLIKNDEGVVSVLINKTDLINKNFDNCKFSWGQS